MKIILRVDFDGNPYLQLESGNSYPVDETTAESELLEYFIREGQKRGIKIKNESGSDVRDDYATIRFKEKFPSKDILFANETKIPDTERTLHDNRFDTGSDSTENS